MIFINKFFNSKNSSAKFILIFFFIISWMSIGTSHHNLFNLTPLESVNRSEIINFLRVFFNLSGLPVLSILFIRIVFKEKDTLLKSNLVFFIPLAYFSLQIPGLLYTSNSIGNLVFVISAINILIIIHLAVKIFDQSEITWFIYISALLLFGVLIQTLISDTYAFLYDPDVYRFYGQVNAVFEGSYIRSSGASRISLVLLIIYFFFIKKLIKFKFLKLVPLLFFCLIIFIYQSRASIILLILFLLLILIFHEKYSLKNIFKYIFTCLIIPFFLSINVDRLKPEEFDKQRWERISERIKVANQECTNSGVDKETALFKDCIKLKVEEKISEEKEDVLCVLMKCNDNSVRILLQDKKLNTTSSGRIDDWKSIINRYNFHNNLFFGYGSQADRFLINQSASNALLYAFASSGLIGFVFFLLFNGIAVFQIAKFFFFKIKKNSINTFSIITMMIIGVRSLVESSYAVFGVDLIIFYICHTLAIKYNIVEK